LLEDDAVCERPASVDTKAHKESQLEPQKAANESPFYRNQESAVRSQIFPFSWRNPHFFASPTTQPHRSDPLVASTQLRGNDAMAIAVNGPAGRSSRCACAPLVRACRS
jgi:hypothetical protein